MLFKDLKQKIEEANEHIKTQNKMLEEKEIEVNRTMNKINEENWAKISELTNEK